VDECKPLVWGGRGSDSDDGDDAVDDDVEDEDTGGFSVHESVEEEEDEGEDEGEDWPPTPKSPVGLASPAGTVASGRLGKAWHVLAAMSLKAHGTLRY